MIIKDYLKSSAELTNNSNSAINNYLVIQDTYHQKNLTFLAKHYQCLVESLIF
ncbi:MAG: hypothetical protein IJE89_06060 [Bacilli bacterium]|nr:hypothetical protein [Bacilli bacterium]